VETITSSATSSRGVVAEINGHLVGALLNIPNAVNGINIPSILVAFVGAVILLVILRLVSGRKHYPERIDGNYLASQTMDAASQPLHSSPSRSMNQ
jgi:uncharacterized membrane protein YeaQ/YmgE (transglycosylase-associated protein family)